MALVGGSSFIAGREAGASVAKKMAENVGFVLRNSLFTYLRFLWAISAQFDNNGMLISVPDFCENLIFFLPYIP